MVSNSKFAEKADLAGVDAIVAEGFEAGGHNGREETTTLELIPLVREVTDKPLIAAGGIATGKQMLATMILGADGVQLGSVFAASEESSAHLNFKQQIVESKEGYTRLSLKQLTPVRLIKNKFALEVEKAEQTGASKEELLHFLGKGRAKKGMFEGDIEEGELEIGQVSALIKKIQPVKNIMNDIIASYRVAREQMNHPKLNF